MADKITSSTKLEAFRTPHLFLHFQRHILHLHNFTLKKYESEIRLLISCSSFQRTKKFTDKKNFKKLPRRHTSYFPSLIDEISMPFETLLLKTEKLLLLRHSKIFCDSSYDKSQSVVVIIPA